VLCMLDRAMMCVCPAWPALPPPDRITQLTPDFFFLGGGEVDLKVSVAGQGRAGQGTDGCLLTSGGGLLAVALFKGAIRYQNSARVVQQPWRNFDT
jgi:hypothetical protein